MQMRLINHIFSGMIENSSEEGTRNNVYIHMLRYLKLWIHMIPVLKQKKKNIS